MNFARLTTRRQQVDIPVDFPANLDPRFDFLRSDEDLALVSMERINFAVKAIERADFIIGRIEAVTVVSVDDAPMDLIPDPPTVERGADMGGAS